jgi:UDP-2-acetamido-2,6-beta-L-arabino-hexul-4-ose reductase
VVTGAGGFLGWHTRARLRAQAEHDVVAVTRDTWTDLPQLVKDADAIIHIAGVNRADADEVEYGNLRLAEDLVAAVRSAGCASRLVYANSVQAGTDSPYGRGKSGAGEILAGLAEMAGADYVDVVLPNLFGEHGRPRYNSFVATFVDAVARREAPTIQDRPVSLLHAQDAAQALIHALRTDEERLTPVGTTVGVQEVYDTLVTLRETYRTGDIPVLDTSFAVDLFNTYRAGLFPAHYPIALTVHADARGRLVETVRSHGGQGQTFVSTTRPGMTRGDHFHLRKIERFVVLSGSARISLRKVLGDEVISFDVSGDRPTVIDMPTLWVHNITNTGDSEVTTLFWTHSLFDPQAPDTYWEKVMQTEETA